MPALLIVGGDHLGTIPKKLKTLGFSTITHLSGRKVQTVKKAIPSDTDLILVLTDYINHNLIHVLKRKAAEKNVPICYAKRSWCSISQALGSCKYCPSRIQTPSY